MHECENCGCDELISKKAYNKEAQTHVEMYYCADCGSEFEGGVTE